ncbi:MAG: Nif11-like leader peptide family natural product precursor [Bacilli bacterium]|nr:Nif11-like leader peptide family natural product precursor [Bacilli bacterium]
MKKELLEGLTVEQIEKFKACKNSEEVLALAKKEGVELSEEQLEAVSGGCGTSAQEDGGLPQTDSERHWEFDEPF